MTSLFVERSRSVVRTLNELTGNNMRVGVFGGTFDPIHLGHLILAEQCREQANLDQLLFVPALLPPHKRQQSLASFAQRVEMVALAISGNAAFRVEEMEKERAGPSYTVDTLTQLTLQRPGDEFYFILGSDSLHDLPLWHEPVQILERAALLVVARPGFSAFPAQELRKKLALREEFPLRYQIVEAPLIEIASRAIRRRLAEGSSVRYLVPRSVEAYIQDKELYRAP